MTPNYAPTSVSIITPTARKNPHFDWLADSICRQLQHRAKPALEWVVVDAMLWGDACLRRQNLARAISGRIPYVHVAPKPCRWQGPHRLTKSDQWALNNARNTGLVVAKGQRVILLDDCTVVDEHWLERHLSYEGHGVAGAYFTYRSARVENGRIVEGDAGPYGLDDRAKSHPEVQRTNGGWAYGLNCSFLLETAIRANGFDQKYDGQAGGDDADAGIRFERAGLPFVWDPRCLVQQVLETHDPVFDHVPWGMPLKEKRPPKELRRRDAEFHFANEVLTERLVYDEPTRYLPLGNTFDLAELRRHYRETGEFKEYPFESELDWRDGQPLSEME